MEQVNSIEPIVIHSMGKVGSSSIYQCLLKMPERFEVYHTHVLNEEGFDRIANGRQLNELRGHHRDSALVLDKYGDRLSSLKIVCLVREPISRNMSAFFENLKLFYDKEEVCENTTLRGLVEYYFTEYNHLLPFEWFDREFQSVFGLDVFSKPFDQDLGFGLYDFTGGGRAIVIRLENLDTEEVQKALRDFLGLETMVLQKENLGDKKHYAEAYRLFKKSIEFSESYLEEMLESRYARYFYSSSERSKLFEKFRSNGNLALEGLESSWKIARWQARAKDAEYRLEHAEIRAEQAVARAEGAEAHYRILAKQARKGLERAETRVRAIERSWSFRLGFYLLHPWKVWRVVKVFSRTRGG